MDDFNTHSSSEDNNTADDRHTPVSHALDVVISAAETPRKSRPARPMQIRRFLSGLVFAAGGIGLMLCVAVGALQDAGAEGRLSLPAVAICMIIGLMLLGGGFGVMATAAPTFDDDEFDRLLRKGNQSLSGEFSDDKSDSSSAEQTRASKNATSVVSDLLEESLV